jgi:hypothetical protein
MVRAKGAGRQLETWRWTSKDRHIRKKRTVGKEGLRERSADAFVCRYLN